MGTKVHSHAFLPEMIHRKEHVYCSGQVSLMATRSLHHYAAVLRTTAQERHKAPTKSAVGKGNMRVGEITVEHRQAIAIAMHAALLSLAAQSCPIVK